MSPTIKDEPLEIVEVAEEEMFFEIDLNAWNYADLKAFRKASAEESAEMFPLLAKVVKAWPYAGKPTAETIESLGLVDLMTLMNAVTQVMNKTFRPG